MGTGLAVTARIWLRQVAPGIGLAFALALLAKLIADSLGGWAVGGGKSAPISPVLCAVLLGLLWRNGFGVALRFNQGLHWVMHTLLKVGIALVGLRLTLAGAGEIAAVALPVVCICISVALLAGAALSRVLTVPRRLGVLLSVGTAVCGCTAVVALSPVIRARNEETGFALVCVVVFGCVGMLLYPWIAGHLFSASPAHAGIFLGTAIHDTSQVVGAALIYSEQHASPEALAAASVTKLLRNLSIAVLIPAAAWLTREPSATAPQTTAWRSFALPGFVIGFVLLVAARTLGDALFDGSMAGTLYWDSLVHASQLVSELFLICGMTALGLSVSFTQLRCIGWRPLAAGLSVAAIVGACSLSLTFAAFRFLH